MAAVSQVVPNLLGGLSQQPDPIKLPGQVREATNAYLDPTFGCKKRPPTQFIKKLANNVPSDAKWFPIFRDEQERYVVAIYRTTTTFVRVWDAKTGVEQTVTIGSTADGTSTDISSAVRGQTVSSSKRINSRCVPPDQRPHRHQLTTRSLCDQCCCLHLMRNGFLFFATNKNYLDPTRWYCCKL